MHRRRKAKAQAAHWLEIIPPEDVVPVVRCKDCLLERDLKIKIEKI